MALYVQRAKNILTDMSQDFMDLNSICTPPINFTDALMKAKAKTTIEVTQIVEKGGNDKEIVASVMKNATVTFGYLIMQLHARGSQKFWREVDQKKLSPYLVFCVTDMYADILSHITMDGYNAAPPLEALCSMDGIAELSATYDQISRLIINQRAHYDDDWIPDKSSCESIAKRHAVYTERLNSSSLLTKVAISVAAASILTVVVLRIWKR